MLKRPRHWDVGTKKQWDVDRMVEVAKFLEPEEHYIVYSGDFVLRIEAINKDATRFIAQEKVNSAWQSFALTTLDTPLGLKFWIVNVFLPKFTSAREEYLNASIGVV